MKKNPFYLLAIAIVISFTACDSDEPEEKEISLDPIDAPVLITKTTAFQEDEDITIDQVIDHSYDDSNYITEEIISLKAVFNDGGKVNYNLKSTFTYDDNKRIVLIATSGSFKEKQEFKYDGNNQTITYSFFNGEAYQLYSKSEIKLNSEGLPIEQLDYLYDDYEEKWDENGDSQIHSWKDKNIESSYTYSSTNNKSASIFRFPMNTKHPKLKSVKDTIRSSETTYNYRTEINPYAFSSVKYSNYPARFTKNLPASSETITEDSTTSYSLVYTYEMNDKNFPSFVREVYSINDISNETIEQQYKSVLEINLEYSYPE